MLTAEEIMILLRTIESAFHCRICIIDGDRNHLFSEMFPQIDTTHLSKICLGIDKKTTNPEFCRKCDDFAVHKHAETVKSAFWKVCPYGGMEIVGTVFLPKQKSFQLFCGIFKPREKMPENSLIYPQRHFCTLTEPFRVLTETEFADLPVLMNLLTKQITELFLASRPEETPRDNPRQFIENFINRDFRHPISLADVAEKLNWTESHTSVRIKELFGKSFVTLLTERRIENAKWLLRNNVTFSIAKTAFVSGFPSPPYFHRVFLKYTGMTPICYRNQFKHDTRKKKK